MGSLQFEAHFGISSLEACFFFPVYLFITILKELASRRFLSLQNLCLVEMSSMAFSVGTCSPRELTRPCDRILVKNSARTEERTATFSTLKDTSAQQLHITCGIDSSSFRRREAIGFGLCLGLLDLFLVPERSVAAEAAPCELTASPSGLAFCDKVVGTGPQALKGQLIKAHYIGKLENGEVFDSSYSRGKPLTFRIGAGEVIKGWDQGILGGDGVPPMLAGGKRLLKIPPELGYGMRGAGCRGGSCIIPPDSVLLFDVEFVGKV